MVTITVNKKVTKKINNKIGSKFGTTRIIKNAIKDIKITCKKNKWNKRRCVCKITEIVIDTEFLVQINKKKIEKSKRSCFDTKTLKVVPCKKEDGNLVPKKPHHKKLDVKSVEIHEMQHVDDVVEHLKKALKERLKKIGNETAECACKDRQTRCKNMLKRLVQNRARAILRCAYKGILNHQHSTEKTARKAQAKHLRVMQEKETQTREKKRQKDSKEKSQKKEKIIFE